MRRVSAQAPRGGAGRTAGHVQRPRPPATPPWVPAGLWVLCARATSCSSSIWARISSTFPCHHLRCLHSGSQGVRERPVGAETPGGTAPADATDNSLLYLSAVGSRP